MVGKNIKRLRQKCGMTQEALAEQLCVTRQAVSNWETEKTQPDVETLGKLAEIFGVSVEEIIYGESKEPKAISNDAAKETIKKGVSFGTVLAIVISYAKWHSIGWAIFHGLLSWVYVIYYALKYL